MNYPKPSFLQTFCSWLHIHPKGYAFIIGGSCAGALIFALIAEHIYGIKPCHLCTYQRYIMMALIALCISIGFFRRYESRVFGRFRGIAKTLRLLCCIILLAGTALSIYHIGVEHHWWQGPASCTSDIPPIDKTLSITDQFKAFKAAMEKKSGAIVRCDVINWRVFGVSATILTAIFYGLLTIFSLLLICYKTSSSVRLQ